MARNRPLDSGGHRRSGRRPLTILVLVLVVVAVLFLALGFLRTGEPEAELEATRAGIGRAGTPFNVAVREGSRGLADVRVEVVQDGETTVVEEKTYPGPRPFWAFWGPRTPEDEFEVVIGRDTVEGLQEGEATVRVVAERPGGLFGAGDPVVQETTVPVRLRPPSLSVLSQQHYVAQGGSGVVVYQVPESVTEEGGRDGVRVVIADRSAGAYSAGSRQAEDLSGQGEERQGEAGDREGDQDGQQPTGTGGEGEGGGGEPAESRPAELFFEGRPLPGGGPGARFALFAAPHDLSQPSGIRLVAVDAVGNESEASFVDRWFPNPPDQDTIELTDGFMDKVVPEILGQLPSLEDQGGLLENYLMINGRLRQQNAEELRDLADESEQEFLWTEPFQQMPGGQVMSSFADRRTYTYQGEPVDQQTHLGFDLATTRRDQVPASNAGQVVMARYFGIYGNTVVIDHGYGLMSLYSHLSSIGVEEGQQVERGEDVGRTGATGLAGGDHLHFTMMVDGEPVSPVEWWDEAWIRDRLKPKLGEALRFGTEGGSGGGAADEGEDGGGGTGAGS